jgi:MoxR-like ATPase
MTAELTPSEQLAIAIEANRPVLLMGAPGTAKTAIVEDIAARRGAYLEVVIASAQDPTTILGIPMPSEDRKYTEPTMPGWARRINDANKAGRDTMLFLDELTTVPPSVAGPLLGVIQSRRADGWTLPDDTRIIAAANPPDLAVGGWAIEPAMANRWAHINWPAPYREWSLWAHAQTSPALQLIADYIDAVPEALLQVPQDVRSRSGAWPSPRAWSNAAALIDAAKGDTQVAALTVGSMAAQTFVQWAAMRDVPSVADMLSGARAIPDRPDAFAQAVNALAANANEETLARTIELLTAAVSVDPTVVGLATRAMVQRNLRAGIAPLYRALQDAGVEF